jgi:CBS domain-containing protein
MATSQTEEAVDNNNESLESEAVRQSSSNDESKEPDTAQTQADDATAEQQTQEPQEPQDSQQKPETVEEKAEAPEDKEQPQEQAQESPEAGQEQNAEPEPEAAKDQASSDEQAEQQNEGKPPAQPEQKAEEQPRATDNSGENPASTGGGAADESRILELSTESFRAFCDDISAMFSISMKCEQKDTAAVTVETLQERFKNLVAVTSAKADGSLEGTFQIIFSREGLFTLAGAIAMPAQMTSLLEKCVGPENTMKNIKSGTLKEAEEVADTVAEACNLLIGSWDRIFRDGLEGHKHLLQTNTFIGEPWDSPAEKVGLPPEQKFTFASYRITISPFPAFDCGVVFPKTMFAEGNVETEDEPEAADKQQAEPQTAAENSEQKDKPQPEVKQQTEGKAEAEAGPDTADEQKAEPQAQPETAEDKEKSAAQTEQQAQDRPEAADEQKTEQQAKAEADGTPAEKDKPQEQTEQESPEKPEDKTEAESEAAQEQKTEPRAEPETEIAAAKDNPQAQAKQQAEEEPEAPDEQKAEQEAKAQTAGQHEDKSQEQVKQDAEEEPEAKQDAGAAAEVEDQSKDQPEQKIAELEQSKEPSQGEVSATIKQMTQSPATLPGEAAKSAIPGIEVSPELCAADVMQKEVVWATSEQSVQQALTKMQQQDSGYIMIGRNEILEGIVSKSDISGATSIYLRPIFAKWYGPLDDATLQIKLKWIMSRPVRTVGPETPLVTIIENICRFGGRCLPVVDQNGRVKGLITVFDIFHKLLNTGRNTTTVGKTVEAPALV